MTSITNAPQLRDKNTDRQKLSPATSAHLFFYLLLLLILSSCEKNETSFFPLEAGRVWHYSIEKYGGNVDSKLKDIIHNMGKAETANESGYVQTSLSGTTSHYLQTEKYLRLMYWLLADGSRVEPEALSATVFRYPLETGTQWQGLITTNSLLSYDAHAQKVAESIPVTVSILSVNETVVVPAGKFRNCIAISASGTKQVPKGKYAYQPKMTISLHNTRWYAAGVGLLKEEHVEESDALQYPRAGYTKTLEKYY